MGATFKEKVEGHPFWVSFGIAVLVGGITFTITHYWDGQTLNSEVARVTFEKEQAEAKIENLKRALAKCNETNPLVGKASTTEQNTQKAEGGSTINNNGPTHIGNSQ